MKRNGQASPTLIVLVAAGVLAVGGGVWALVGGSGTPTDQANLPKELTLAALKEQAEKEPDKAMDAMRDLRRREDLTEEQREQAGQNMRRVMEEMLDKNVDKYYAAATDDEKQKVLDQQIDEWTERMKQMEERRKQWEAERDTKGTDGDKQKEEARRDQGRRNGLGGGTREQRKDRSEARDPDKSARRMAYFGAVHKRMAERGIEMPRGMWGGGPRGGGAGGGGQRGGGEH